MYWRKETLTRLLVKLRIKDNCDYGQLAAAGTNRLPDVYLPESWRKENSLHKAGIRHLGGWVAGLYRKSLSVGWFWLDTLQRADIQMNLHTGRLQLLHSWAPLGRNL